MQLTALATLLLAFGAGATTLEQRDGKSSAAFLEAVKKYKDTIHSLRAPLDVCIPSNVAEIVNSDYDGTKYPCARYFEIIAKTQRKLNQYRTYPEDDPALEEQARLLDVYVRAMCEQSYIGDSLDAAKQCRESECDKKDAEEAYASDVKVHDYVEKECPQLLYEYSSVVGEGYVFTTDGKTMTMPPMTVASELFQFDNPDNSKPSSTRSPNAEPTEDSDGDSAQDNSDGDSAPQDSETRTEEEGPEDTSKPSGAVGSFERLGKLAAVGAVLCVSLFVF